MAGGGLLKSFGRGALVVGFGRGALVVGLWLISTGSGGVGSGCYWLKADSKICVSSHIFGQCSRTN